MFIPPLVSDYEGTPQPQDSAFGDLSYFRPIQLQHCTWVVYICTSRGFDFRISPKKKKKKN